MKIAMIGGDARMTAVAHLLEEHGASVYCLALPPGAGHTATDLFTALQGAEAVILPLPATRDGIYPTTVTQGPVPRLTDIISRADEECLLLGGMLSPSLCEMAHQNSLDYADYYRGENLLEKNAALTAEAAIGMAIHDLPCSLSGAPVAVIGAGRIARHLVRLLLAFSAKVTVYARAKEARAAMAVLGAVAHPIPAGAPLCLPRRVRAVFCTAPALLFDRTAVAALSPGTPFYDLGGGGIDRAAARAHDIPLPPSGGLPGNFSPETAGAYLFDEICAILREKRGVTL